MEKIDKLIREYQEYAEKNGFVLNPNEKIVRMIVSGLLEKEKGLGARFCPCRKISGNKEEDKKIICPCAYHLEEIKKQGSCSCGLFVKK
jgi:ferredoxin-thioredoxin reductase catalytic chain